MLSRILPLVFAIFGLGGGVGAGLFLRPATGPADQITAKVAGDETKTAEYANAVAADAGTPEEGAPDYVKMNNQFVVPVVKDGRVAAMVVLSLSLEVKAGNTEAVYQREPKLRDAFLQVLFDHANVGGFAGSFTDGSNLVVLRTSLKEAASLVLGTMVSDVLITDIARQDG
ncbi:MAG: hypothetical protein FD152_55 [Xanthobacteraceae bacterium]|nr:MAG: hypothetical protein FD152_55 [Xanthobacteraceae bacterium]